MSDTTSPATYFNTPIEEDALDAVFYRDGLGADLIAIVDGSKHELRIYCTGALRAYNHQTDEHYRCALDFVNAGYRTDDALNHDEGRGIIEFINNPWFTIIDEVGDEVAIEHDLMSAWNLAQYYAENGV